MKACGSVAPGNRMNVIGRGHWSFAAPLQARKCGLPSIPGVRSVSLGIFSCLPAGKIGFRAATAVAGEPYNPTRIVHAIACRLAPIRCRHSCGESASDKLLSMKKPVLLVIDMLNDFLGRWEPQRRKELTGAIDELVGAMREFSLPVLWVRQEFEADLSDAFPEMRARNISVAIKGTPGCRIAPELKCLASDRVIVKKRYSAFFGTGLDAILAELQPDVLILAGINTHACVRTTAIDAYQRDWPVILALDCIDSYDREHHEISLRYMKDKIAGVLGNREIRRALEDGECGN